MSANYEIKLDSEDYEMLREALELGLACLGEVQRVKQIVVNAELCGEKPEWLRLQTPGDADSVACFATALQTLSILKHAAERALSKGSAE